MDSNKFSYRVYSDLSLIEREQWDSGLNEDDYYMNYDFLHLTNLSVLNVDKYYYVMIFCGDVKIANIVMFSFLLDFYKAVNISAKRIIAIIRKIYKKAFFQKVLFCGLPVSTVDNSIRIFNKEYTADILNILNCVIKKISTDEKANIIFYKDFCSNDLEWSCLLKGKSNTLVKGLSSNEIKIIWNTFDDYLNNLHKRYRNPLKKILRKRDECTIRILKGDEITFTNEFYSLYEQVNEDSEYQLEKFSINFFKNITCCPNIDSFYILIEGNNAILGYVLVVEKKDCLIPLFLGYSKKHNKTYDIYFNLVYKVLELAIERKKSMVKFGQTADYFKHKIGCYPVDVWWYIRLNNVLLRPFTSLIFRKMFPEKKVTSFDLFKS